MDFRTRSENVTFGVRATALIIDDGKIFMIQKNHRYYTVGGAVKIRETTEEALRREVREELAMDVEIQHLAFIVENQFDCQGHHFHNIEFHYVVKPLDPVPKTTADQIRNYPLVAMEIDNLVNYDVNPSFLKKELRKWPGHIVHIKQKD